MQLPGINNMNGEKGDAMPILRTPSYWGWTSIFLRSRWGQSLFFYRKIRVHTFLARSFI